MLCFGIVIVETGSNFNQLGRKQVSMCFYLDFTFSFKRAMWSAKLSGLIKGSFKSIAKISAKKMSHINVSKHLWGNVMSKVTKNQIQTVIFQGIRKGSWNLLSNGTVKILYKYKGRIVVVTGKVINKIFNISDAWVWNGKGKP